MDGSRPDVMKQIYLTDVGDPERATVSLESKGVELARRPGGNSYPCLRSSASLESRSRWRPTYPKWSTSREHRSAGDSSRAWAMGSLAVCSSVSLPCGLETRIHPAPGQQPDVLRRSLPEGIRFTYVNR